MSGRRLIAGLAWADLRHEWVATLCLVLALAAVLGPLLLLLGLKQGVVLTLRERLVEDPAFRALAPRQTQALDPAWFDATAARDDVAFVLPTILRGSSIIRIEVGREAEVMDLLPSAAGDPLLTENGVAVPGPGEVVLSADAADRLGVAVGAAVTLVATRVHQGRRQAGRQALTVTGILPPRADPLTRAYVPFDLALDVETFREGRGVPARNWPGGDPAPWPSFDGALVLAPRALDPIVAQGLVIGTGFAAIEALDPATFSARTGFEPPAGWWLRDVHTLRQPVTLSSLRQLRDKLRGRGAVVLPYVRDLTLTVAGEAWPVFPLSPGAADRAALGLPPLPWGDQGAEAPFADAARILAPRGAAVAPGPAEATLGDLRFPVRVDGMAPGGRAWVPLALAGQLRTATVRPVVWDGDRHALVLARPGFRGFRLYARSIDDVPGLYRWLRKQGIEPVAELAAIERVQVLDRGLTRVFWLVAVVGIGGGLAVLVVSLYGAVERKKRELALMRLMGFARRDVFLFPVHQALALAVMASALALALFAALSTVINRVFAGDLALGERICRLSGETLVAAVALAVLGAVLSSLFAAWRTTRIEPAEAIRVE